MFKIYRNISCMAAALLVLASCKKEGDQFFIKDGSFTGSGLTASSSTIVLNKATENDVAISFNWSAAYFGEKPVVAYTLQLDKPSDTSGANGWVNAKSFVAGNNILSYAFITKDLNNILNTMGLPGGTAANIAFRVKASVPQYNGSESSVTPIYSNTQIVSITPYSLSLYIPGAYQGWNPGAAPLLNPADGRPGLYEAYEYMPGTGKQYFKYTNAPDWDHTNFGDGGNNTFSTDGNAGGLYTADGGYYELMADFNTNKWYVAKTNWGILGDASPGGWNTDTDLIYDPTAQVWKVTCNMIKSGSFKFRANHDWVIDFGIDAGGNLKYADNPFFGYTSGLNNLSVPEDGNYTITLDLHISGKYTYILHKN